MHVRGLKGCSEFLGRGLIIHYKIGKSFKIENCSIMDTYSRVLDKTKFQFTKVKSNVRTES